MSYKIAKNEAVINFEAAILRRQTYSARGVRTGGREGTKCEGDPELLLGSLLYTLLEGYRKLKF